MKRLALFCMAGLLMARDGQGIRPRPQAADYPSQEKAGDVTIGAAVVPPDQAKHMFATDLRNYIVVELSVYPDKTVDLSSSDFALKIGAQDLLRPAAPRAIAAVLQRKDQPAQSQPRAGDITVYPSATIGYESGPSYDPATGRQRRGGVYTGAGVGVGVGGAPGPQAPAPASTDRDRATMQQELEDKALPEGPAAKAVAGYLYFPRPSGKHSKNALYELTYYGADGRIRVPLKPPASK